MGLSVDRTERKGSGSFGDAERPRRGTLHHAVTNRILGDIRNGILSVGDKLPSEADLVSRHGVSITTVRRSLAELERQGIVRREHGRGTFLSLQPSPTGRSTVLKRLGILFEGTSAPDDQAAQNLMLETIAMTCRREKIGMFLAEIDMAEREAGVTLIETFEGVSLDGVLVFLPDPTQAAERLALLAKEFRALVVLVPGKSDSTPDLPMDCIDVDLRTGMREVMGYLLGLGHRRIGYIGPHVSACLAGDEIVTAGRWQTYRDALMEAGISVAEELLVEVPYGTIPDVHAAEHLLGLLKNTDPATAVFAANDWLAALVLNWLWEAGYRVPDDVSVVGWDDLPMAAHLVPPLTTVPSPFEELVSQALDLLRTRLRQPDSPLRKVTIPTRLVRRSSVSLPTAQRARGRQPAR